METVLIGLGILLTALVIWFGLQNGRSQKKSDLLESQLGELRRDLQTIGTAQAQSTGQIQTVAQTVAQRLESVTNALREGVTHSAHIASQGQTAIATELKNTREQIGLIQKQIGEVQEQSRGLSQATQSLEQVLGGAKTRGLLGEVTLQRLLEDCLPPSQFTMQYRFSSGEAADAVIFLRDDKLMVIDSKLLAHERPVQVGVRQGDKAQITKGVNEGEQVVTVGGLGLEDKAKVKISSGKDDDEKKDDKKDDQKEDDAKGKGKSR